MTRVQIILSVLAAVLVVVLFWLLLWSPQQEELDGLRADIEDTQDQQRTLAAERDALRNVRDEAPGIEAELAAATSIVPSDPALPAALRQLQQAADEAQLVLQAVSPSRPTQVEGADEGVSAIDVNVQVIGTYFQVVDFLRRIEDPSISPRGLIWGNLTLAPEELPNLNASISGTMFAHLPAPPADEPEDDEDAADEDDDADVTVEVEEGDE